jgi:hypothetical protein
MLHLIDRPDFRCNCEGLEFGESQAKLCLLRLSDRQSRREVGIYGGVFWGIINAYMFMNSLPANTNPSLRHIIYYLSLTRFGVCCGL